MRSDQPAHVVIGKAVTARGVADLLDLAGKIIDVIHARGIRIALVRETVQRVIHVQDGLVLAIDLAGEIADGIVNVVFRQRRGEGRLRDAAKRVIDERRGVLGGIRNAGEIVFQIVSVCGDVLPEAGESHLVPGYRVCTTIRIS